MRSGNQRVDGFRISSLAQALALRNQPAAAPADRYPHFALLTDGPLFGVAAANSFYSYVDVMGQIVGAIAGPLHLDGGEDFARLGLSAGVEDAAYVVRGFNGRLVSGFDSGEWHYGWQNYRPETVTALSLNILNGALEGLSILVDLDELVGPCTADVFTAIVTEVNARINLSSEPAPATVIGWLLAIGQTGSVALMDCVVDSLVEAPLEALVNLSKSLAGTLDVLGKASSAGSFVERLTALSGFPIGFATNFMTPVDSALIVVGDPWGPRIVAVNGVSPDAPGDPLQTVARGGTLSITGKRFRPDAGAALPSVVVTGSDGRSFRINVAAGQFNGALDGAVPPPQSITIPLPAGVSEKIRVAVETGAGRHETPPILEIPPVFDRLAGGFIFRHPVTGLAPPRTYTAEGKGFVPEIHRVSLGGTLVVPAETSSGSRLVFPAPADLPVGAHEVKIRWRSPADDVAASPPQRLRVLGPPVISAIAPMAVQTGRTIQLTGLNFGDERELVTVHYSYGAVAETEPPLRVLDQGTSGADQASVLLVRVDSFVAPPPGTPVQVRVETPAGISAPFEIAVRDDALPELTRSLMVPELTVLDAIRYANQDPAPAGTITRVFYCEGDIGGIRTIYPASWKPQPPEAGQGPKGVSVPPGLPFAEGGVCNEVVIPDVPAEPGPITWEGFSADQIRDTIHLGADNAGDVNLSELLGGPPLRGPHVTVRNTGVATRVIGGGLVIEGAGKDDPLHRNIVINLEIAEATGTVVTIRNCNGVELRLLIHAAAGGAEVGVLIENCRDVDGRIVGVRGATNAVIVRDSEDCDLNILGMAGYETGLLLDGGKNNTFPRVVAGVVVDDALLTEVIDPGQGIGVHLTGGTEGNRFEELHAMANATGVLIDDARNNWFDQGTVGVYLTGSTAEELNKGRNGEPTANGIGIHLTAGAVGNRIGPLFVANNMTGVRIDGGDGNLLEEMRIGGRNAGLDPLGNGVGILIDGSLSQPPAGNTVSACQFYDNTVAGLSITSLTLENAVIGNRIGANDLLREGGARSDGTNGMAGMRIAGCEMLSQIRGNIITAELTGIAISDSRLIELADNIVGYVLDEGLRIERSHQISLHGERICGSLYAQGTCFAGYEGNVGLRIVESSAVTVNDVRAEALGGDGIVFEGAPTDYFVPSRIEGIYEAGSVVPEAGREAAFSPLISPPDDRTGSGREIRVTFNKGDGVVVRDGARGITLSGLRAVNNEGSGVVLDNPGEDVILQESSVTDNLMDGVTIRNAAAGGLRIGLPRAGNLIGANQGWGVSALDSEALAVQGNFIVFNGLNSGDTIGGVRLQATHDVRIGGNGPDDGNLVSANRNDGIQVVQPPALNPPASYVIENNFIGTTFPGNAALPNAGFGIRIAGNAGLSEMSARIARNLIACNAGGGIGLDKLGGIFGPTIEENIIGRSTDNPVLGLPHPDDGIVLTDVNRVSVHGNVIGENTGRGINAERSDAGVYRGNRLLRQGADGIVLANDSDDNLIDRNEIIGGGGRGVVVDGPSIGNTLTGNAISSHTLAGIALTGGGNNGIPAPAIRSVGRGSINRYHFFGDVAAGTPDGSVVEIFADTEDEGRHFLARALVSQGRFSVHNVRQPPGVALEPLNFTATVTDLNGNTSAFGPVRSLIPGLRANVGGCPVPPDARFGQVVASERDGRIFLTHAADCLTTPLAASVFGDAWPSLAGHGSGLRLALGSTRDGNEEIYWGSADALLRRTNGVAADREPSLSPDGSRIAFVSDRDGNAEIYVMNADGSNVVRITNNPAEDLQPDWSPDGAQLVFASNRTGRFQLFTASGLDGTATTQRTFGSGDHTHPSWRKLEHSIAMQVDEAGDSSRIGVLDLVGGAVTLIPNAGWSDQQPEWIVSDGGIAHLVISSRPDPGSLYHLYLLEFSGELLWRISPEGSEDRNPSVAP